MAKASIASIVPREAEHFGGLAADWWNPSGSSAMLHKLNPVRLQFVRERIDAHWGGDRRAVRPLAGKTALDVGCGAGLMCEPLARMGATVTGVDAAPENVAAAKAHAEAQGLEIEYVSAEVSALSGGYDLVTSMEVIEHVADPGAFASALASRLAPGGLMILSTPNRTALSRVGLVTLAERFGAIPPGTHDWDRFLTPDELTTLLSDAGMQVIETRGLSFNPAKGFVLSQDLALNYLVAAVRAG